MAHRKAFLKTGSGYTYVWKVCLSDTEQRDLGMRKRNCKFFSIFHWRILSSFFFGGGGTGQLTERSVNVKLNRARPGGGYPTPSVFHR